MIRALLAISISSTVANAGGHVPWLQSLGLMPPTCLSQLLNGEYLVQDRRLPSAQTSFAALLHQDGVHLRRLALGAEILRQMVNHTNGVRRFFNEDRGGTTVKTHLLNFFNGLRVVGGEGYVTDYFGPLQKLIESDSSDAKKSVAALQAFLKVYAALAKNFLYLTTVRTSLLQKGRFDLDDSEALVRPYHSWMALMESACSDADAILRADRSGFFEGLEISERVASIHHWEQALPKVAWPPVVIQALRYLRPFSPTGHGFLPPNQTQAALLQNITAAANEYARKVDAGHGSQPTTK